MESEIKQIYLLVDYDEGSREDITILGGYSSFEKAEEVGKSLLRKQRDEFLAERTRALEAGEIDEEEDDDEDDDHRYFIASCPLNPSEVMQIDYFEYEIKL